MLLNLNYIKAVSAFTSHEEADDWMVCVNIKVTEDSIIYTGLNPKSTARIIAPRTDAGTEKLDVYMYAGFKLPAKMRVPVQNVEFNFDTRAFTIPDLSIMGRLYCTAVDNDTADTVFQSFWKDAVLADRYVLMGPDDMVAVQRFLYWDIAKKNLKEHIMPRPYILMSKEDKGKESYPYMAGWSMEAAGIYYGAIVCPYRPGADWPLYNMVTKQVSGKGPDHLANYYED